MKKLVWGLTFFGIALWSLLSWGTYLLLGGTSEFLTANAELVGANPEWQYWLQAAIRFAEQFGAAAIWIVWAIGGLVALGCGWLIARLLKPRADAASVISGPHSAATK